MAWIKVQKTRAYFSRFQVQFRRRRDCLTDYQQRQNLIIQDNDKYDAPKYRFVVRKSNKRILCQVVASRIGGDHIMAVANSSELPEFGVKQGLTNYSAAYCTGLLCARRLLTKLGMEKIYTGNKQVGKFFENEDNEERRSLRCFLDIGLARSSTGANVFGALKGAVDGGLNIPYSGDRLAAGYYDKKSGKYNEAALSDRIYGKHVSEYMQVAKAEDEEWYKSQFGVYIKNGVNADQLKSIYEKAHEAIRAKPMIKRDMPMYNPEKKLKCLDKKARKVHKQDKFKARLARVAKRANERVAAKQAMVNQLKK
uniref:Ribosomal protein L5 n=1 Tax=Trepomonas sp. PC1 TaxID=1076344 RepID=A0A146KAG6_9EUKA|eukprot:JAP93820.1 Ribosomal protein L5 [Trepomonas sp. PC1]